MLNFYLEDISTMMLNLWLRMVTLTDLCMYMFMIRDTNDTAVIKCWHLGLSHLNTLIKLKWLNILGLNVRKQYTNNAIQINKGR